MEKDFLLWLNRIDGIGNKRQALLLESLGSAEAVFKAGRAELKGLPFLNEQLIHKIVSAQDTNALGGFRRELEKSGMRFIALSEAEYPALLKEISEPPAGLYVIGGLPLPGACLVSMVGSRKCSEYGLSVSYRFSGELASAGAVVVSGMARGVDSMSHRGALDAGGVTVAVLGCGADVCYPPENRQLMRRIQENGCVISEYPPGTRPSAGLFPARNRIISGLSRATVVVEAGRKSGTLITVDQALSEGREVMAVPGNVTSKLSEGTNGLIRQGATPVTCGAEILEQLGIAPAAVSETADFSLAPAEKLVYDCVNFEPTAIDAIYDRLGTPPGDINYVLMLLEMRKLIRRLPGQRVARV